MQIVSTSTHSGLKYKGLYSAAVDSKTAILHVHGMSGSIYFNSFYPAFYEQFPKENISFLAGENRGEYTMMLFDREDGSLAQLGNALEKFEDCIEDIDAWLEFLKGQGNTEIWLSGHSLGCSKIAYYVNQKQRSSQLDPAIKGLILLSPADMIGEIDPEEHKSFTIEAKQMVVNGEGQKLLSRLVDDWAPLSADTYLNFFDVEGGSNLAIFNFGNPELGWDVVNSISLPVIAFTGTKDIPVVGKGLDANECMRVLEQELINCPRKETVVFEEGEHDFVGFADEMVEKITQFINS